MPTVTAARTPETPAAWAGQSVQGGDQFIRVVRQRFEVGTAQHEGVRVVLCGHEAIGVESVGRGARVVRMDAFVRGVDGGMRFFHLARVEQRGETECLRRDPLRDRKEDIPMLGAYF